MARFFGWLGAARRRSPRLKLRFIRFRRLLESYGRLLELRRDAAEKQGGEFIFDRQYVRTLVEASVAVAEEVVFDLNVMAGEAHLPLYEQLERLADDARSLVHYGFEALDRAAGSALPSRTGGAEVASAVAAAPVVYRATGVIVSRGVASGPVFKLDRASGPPPEGAVLVAAALSAADPAAAFLDGAAALLLDRGSAADELASMARQRRLPCIAGLGDATARLAGGAMITVDAEDNAVYEGRVEPLLLLAGDDEEEAEYRLLRATRRRLFALSADAGPAAGAAECRTILDLVHLAHALAGDALHRRVAEEAPVEEGSLRIVRLAGEGGSRALAALEAGLEGPPGATTRLALAAEEHACLFTAHGAGFDLIDAVISGARAANHVYCRFAPRFGEGDTGARRGRIAEAVLSRLDMATARTEREVSAWAAGLGAAEAEARVALLARLAGWLARDGDGLGVDEAARAFLQRHR